MLLLDLRSSSHPEGRAVTPWFPASCQRVVIGSWHTLVEAGGLSEEMLWRAILNLRESYT